MSDDNLDLVDPDDKEEQQDLPLDDVDPEPQEGEGDAEEQQAEAEAGAEDGDEELIVTIGDEPQKDQQSEAAPEWVKALRKTNREIAKQNRELKKKLEDLEQPKQSQVKLGQKPKLEDFDYDAEKYEQELDKWYKVKKQVDDQNAAAESEQKNQAEQWQQKISHYEERKSELKVKDFEESEAVVLESLSETQQGIIVQGADNPALVVYALGRNPDKAKELSLIKDPVKFAFTVAKLEKELKVSNRKAPPPERKISGSGSKSSVVDSTLDRLRAEAERTGNYTKVVEYKRMKRQAKN